MRVSVCVGDYATIPYGIEGLEITVYSMEELCYCLKENAFLLDASLMQDSLVTWVEKECGLKELSKELYQMIHKKGSLSAFVIMIMEYVGMYDSSVVREVERVLKQGAGLSHIEKRKSQLDYLVKKKKYMAAIHGYDTLLSKWQEVEQEGGELPAARVRAAIFHNKGVACVGLMQYGRAAEAFENAFKTVEAKEHLLAFLAAKRMELPEEDYIDLAADLVESYHVSLELEKKMELVSEQWKEQPEYQRLLMRKEWRNGSDKQKYYDENESLTGVLKHSYRNSVSE